jgi:hypothetical protein
MRCVLLAMLLAAGCQQSDVSRKIGARCDMSSDCDRRCLVDSKDYPGSFCTLDCNSKLECPGGTTCADADGGVCLFECNSDPDCAFLGVAWTCKAVDLRGGGIKVMVCRGG